MGTNEKQIKKVKKKAQDDLADVLHVATSRVRDQEQQNEREGERG